MSEFTKISVFLLWLIALLLFLSRLFAMQAISGIIDITISLVEENSLRILLFSLDVFFTQR